MGIGVIAREVRLGCGPGPDGVHAVCAAGVRGRAEPAAFVESYEQGRSSGLESVAVQNVRHQST